MSRVLIICDSFKNLGDFLIAEVQRRGLSVVGDVNTIDILQWNFRPEYAEYASSVSDYLGAPPPGRILRRGEVARNVIGGNYDVIIYGGGNMIRDNVSNMFLGYCIMLFAWQRLLGKTFYIQGSGASKLQENSRRSAFKIITSLAHRIVMRDEKSRVYVRDILGAKNTELKTDSVFYLNNIENFKTAIAAPKADRNGRSVLICVNDDLAEGKYFDFDSVARRLAETFNPFQNILDVNVVAHEMAGDFNPETNDRLVAAMTRAGFVASSSEALADPDALLDTYNATNIVVSNRLHSCIIGAIFDLEIIAIIDGSKKLEEFAKIMNWSTLKTYDESYAISLAVSAEGASQALALQTAIAESMFRDLLSNRSLTGLP